MTGTYQSTLSVYDTTTLHIDTIMPITKVDDATLSFWGRDHNLTSSRDDSCIFAFIDDGREWPYDWGKAELKFPLPYHDSMEYYSYLHHPRAPLLLTVALKGKKIN